MKKTLKNSLGALPCKKFYFDNIEHSSTRDRSRKYEKCKYTKHCEECRTRTIFDVSDRSHTFSPQLFSNPIHYVLLHPEKDRRVSCPTAQLSTTFAVLISPVRSTRTLSTLRCVYRLLFSTASKTVANSRLSKDYACFKNLTYKVILEQIPNLRD